MEKIAEKYDIVWHATDTEDEPEEHSSLGPPVGALGTHDSPQEHWYVKFEDAVDSFNDISLPPPPPSPPPPPTPPRPIAAPGVHPKQPDIDEIKTFTDKLKKRFKNSLRLK